MLGGLEEKPKEGYVQEGVAKGLVSVPCPPLGGEYYPPCPPRAETPAVCNSDFNMFTHISAYLSLAIATNSWLTDHLIIRLPSTTRSPHSICYPPPKCSWLAQPPRSWPQELLGSEIWHLLLAITKAVGRAPWLTWSSVSLEEPFPLHLPSWMDLLAHTLS